MPGIRDRGFMTYKECRTLITIPEQPPDIELAIEELENRGYRFCVDFGYENAVSFLANIENIVAEEVL